MSNQLYKSIFQTLPGYFIEQQRPRFEAVFFNGHETDTQIRQTEHYAVAFAGWLAAMQEKHAYTQRYKTDIREKLHLNDHLQDKTDSIKVDEVKKRIIKKLNL